MTQSSTRPADEQASALHENIARNGAQSYYYAHKKRDTGEAPAPPPVHVVLEKADVTPTTSEITTTETIFTYQFLDDGSKVKVYIPLEGVGAAISDESICPVFTERSISISIKDYKPNRTMKLAVKELCGSIVPESCSFKRLANKVVVTLHKADAAVSWSKLSAK